MNITASLPQVIAWASAGNVPANRLPKTMITRSGWQKRWDRIPETSPLLRQMVYNDAKKKWRPYVAFVWGGKEYVVQDVSPSGKVILRKEYGPFGSAESSDYLVIENDEQLLSLEQNQPHPSMQNDKDDRPHLEIVGDTAEIAIYDYFIRFNTKKLWRQGKRPKIPVVAADPRHPRDVARRKIEAALNLFPPFLLEGLEKVVVHKASKRKGCSASYHHNVINIYGLDLGIMLELTLIHELMHHIVFRIFGEQGLDYHAEWIRAMRLSNGPVSRYAQENLDELFAETGTLYILTHGGRWGELRHRSDKLFAVLDSLLYDCFKIKPVRFPASI